MSIVELDPPPSWSLDASENGESTKCPWVVAVGPAVPSTIPTWGAVNSLCYYHFKVGVHMKAVFWLGIMVLMRISRLRFKQSRISMILTYIYVLGRFVNFLVILGVFGDK